MIYRKEMEHMVASYFMQLATTQNFSKITFHWDTLRLKRIWSDQEDFHEQSRTVSNRFLGW